MKVRITMTNEYKLIPKYYPNCTTPEEMMAVDKEAGYDEMIEGWNIKYELIKEKTK